MPRKTASQEVSSYDNEPELPKLLRPKSNQVDLGRNEKKRQPYEDEKELNTTQKNDEKPCGSDKDLNLKITEVSGDIFSAPPRSVLIHACNCEGAWGAGIALAFKQKYPEAFKVYHSYCNQGKAKVGKALLVPPVDRAHGHYIGCLFTSTSHGKRKDTPEAILQNTKPAMVDLLQQTTMITDDGDLSVFRMCRINSGLFNVPWEETKRVLENIKLDLNMPIEIFAFEKDNKEKK